MLRRFTATTIDHHPLQFNPLRELFVPSMLEWRPKALIALPLFWAGRVRRPAQDDDLHQSSALNPHCGKNVSGIIRKNTCNTLIFYTGIHVLYGDSEASKETHRSK